MFRTVKSACVMALLVFVATNAFGQEFLGGSFKANGNSPVSMTFFVNPDSGFTGGGDPRPPLTFSDLVDAARDACDAWNDLSTYTGVTFSIDDSDSTKTPNQAHLIYFGYTGTAGGYPSGDDVKMNYTINWYPDDDQQSAQYDLRGGLTHELGHIYGLGDLDSLKTEFDDNTMWHKGRLPDWFRRDLEAGDKAGAIYVTGAVMGGVLPYSQVWSLANSLTIPLNVFVNNGDSLLVTSNCTVSLNGHDIVALTGGYIGFDRNNTTGKFSPFVAVVKSDGKYKGFYHSLSTALDSLSTGGAGSYIYIGDNYTINSGETVSIPANKTIKFKQYVHFYVSGTLNIAGGVTFDKQSTYNWSGIKVNSTGTLNITGGITIQNVLCALEIHSSNITFPNFSTTYINNCNNPASSNSAIIIYDCSPMIKYIQFSNSATSSDSKAIYVNGSSACPNLYNLTINDAYYGIHVYNTSDAILKYSEIENVGKHCINFDSDGSSSGGIDISWAQTDVCPDTTSGDRGIYNPTPKVKVKVYNTWWGSSTPFPGTIFQSPDSVGYAPFAGSAFDIGASKIAPYEQNPFHVALEYEQIGDWEQVLEIYYGVIQNGNDLLWNRMAIKQILKVDELSKRGFANLREIIGSEMPTAGSWYKPFLDFILCEILIKEGNYRQAISELLRNADVYKGSTMEVEMLTRVANIYGDLLGDKAKAKEYADRAAALDPGNELLEFAYHSAGIEYNPALFNSSHTYMETGIAGYAGNQQATTPENQDKEYISVAPNPANPVATITYSIRNPSHVKLTIYSITGQKVATLVDRPMSAGTHAVSFNGSNYGSGIYFYSFSSNRLHQSGKLLILK